MANQNESNPGAARIPLVLPPAWGEAEHDAVGVFPHVRNFVLNNWPDGDARGLNGVAVLMNHPALAKGFLAFNNHVATTNTLSKRIAEMLILRIGWLRRSEYEFVQHVVLGKRAGLTDDDIQRIQAGPDAAGWDPVEADLIRAVDELNADAAIQESTWQRLSGHFTQQQLLDVVFTVGCYEIMAMVFNTCKVPYDPGLEPMSPETKARMLATRSDR